MQADKDLDFTEPDSAPHVLEMWSFGKGAFGWRQWPRVIRVALFSPGDMPSRAEIAAKRVTFARFIETMRPRHVFVIPTPDAQMGERSTTVTGTQVWAALKAPDSLAEMRGTWWKFNEHTTVTAVHPIARRVKEMHRWQMARWLRQATHGKVLMPRALETIPRDKTAPMIKSMAARSVAVDLEFLPASGKVMAIGISDGHTSVSIPWDSFMPAGANERTRALLDSTCESRRVGEAIIHALADVLASPHAKYAHNFVADIPILRRLGFVVNGPVLDTYAAHAIAFPESRHALQLAAADLLEVPPWKSLYKPRTEKYVNKEDEEYWTCDPLALREYNAKDAFYTWHLAQKVFPYVETSPLTGECLHAN